MKKQLIAVGFVALASFLIAPSVVFADGDACAPVITEGMTEDELMAAKADMMGSSECMNQRLGSVEQNAHGHGVSIYGSFRTGLVFGGGEDTAVANFGSRWGIRGSAEVSEGLTAAFRYEGTINTTNAEFGGGAGHAHEEVEADEDSQDPPEEISMHDSHGHAETDANGGPGGRLSFISLSGGFGTITAGQIWSASANHYGFAVDPSVFNGSFGGASGRPGSTISYSSSAGDVSFQIDKVTGENERLEFGASAVLGPVGVGLGYYKNANDEENFTGFALSAGAGGVGLSIGLGNSEDDEGETTDTTIISVSGALGDSGISYGIQVANAEDDDDDQNLVSLVNTLGPGASIVFEHVDPGGDAESVSNLALKVDF